MHPQGTWVRYWPGARDEVGRLGRLRSVWWATSSGQIVVKVTGYVGGIAEAHVEPLTLHEIARLGLRLGLENPTFILGEGI